MKANRNFTKTLNELQNHIDYINLIFYTDREQEVNSEIDKIDFKSSAKFYRKLPFLS